MIDVARDAIGVRIALEEIFEEDFRRARIAQNVEQSTAETRARIEASLPPRTLSPGYYTFAQHLLRLDDERRAGISFRSSELAAFEVNGLLALESARNEYEYRHPACSACGSRQQTRFSAECQGCGAKFRQKKRR